VVVKMVSKVTIGILIFLVLLTGSLSVHSYMLRQQVNILSEQLMSSQAEQADRIGTVTDELISFKGETLNRIDNLKEEVDETITSAIATTMTRIDMLGEDVDRTIARVNTARNEIRDISDKLTQSVMNATEIYQEVSQGIVRITDGKMTGIGSGFVLDTEGHIVTAHHVVEGLTEIKVILHDGSVATATIAGSCQFSDVAVLTLEGEPVTKPLKFANSSSVLVGQPVVTVGNPFDLTETLTSGIVSQLNRFISIEYDPKRRWVTNLIQFDAAVNFGNSGCPLFNSEGEVIGMVVARINPELGEGIYYAVSSNKVRRVTASLISKGTFDYPWLGIAATNLTPEVVQSRGLDTINGVLVNKTVVGSPAQAAGIKANDVITAIDGKAIRDLADLTSYLGEHKSPNDEATITLMRGNTTQELTLTIGKQRS